MESVMNKQCEPVELYWQGKAEATLSTKNPILTGLVLKPGLRSDIPATNSRRHDRPPQANDKYSSKSVEPAAF
jgi:hypothetical protein